MPTGRSRSLPTAWQDSGEPNDTTIEKAIPLCGKSAEPAAAPRARLAAGRRMRHDRGDRNEGRKQCGMLRGRFS